jgi:hypothetical protein
MTEYRRNVIVVGALLFLFVVVFLMSDPHDIFATSYFFIDTELSKSSGLEVPIRTKMELGTEEHMQNFPRIIADWTGYDYDTTRIETTIPNSVVLMRTYRRKILSQPVDLVIGYSGSPSSFYSPLVCYPVLDYFIEEEGHELVYVKDVSWLARSKDLDINKLPDWAKKEIELKSIPLSELGYWVSVKRLLISKWNNDKIIDRQVVLYFYIKDRSITPKYGMLRCSAQIPLSGPYDSSLQGVKELMSEAIPLLFEPIKPSDIFLVLLARHGAGGYFAIFLLFFVPLAIIAYPVLRAKKAKTTKSELEGEQSTS